MKGDAAADAFDVKLAIYCAAATIVKEVFVGERLVVWKHATIAAAVFTTCAAIVEENSTKFDVPFHSFSANDLQSFIMLLPLLLEEYVAEVCA